MTSLDDAARQLAALLDNLGAPYAIMGGLAVRIHALPRPTFDVDFTVALPREALGHLYREAEKLGFLIPAAQESGWIDQVRGFPVVKLQLILTDRVIDLDLFLAESPFQRQVLERRQRHSAEGWEGWFVTPEDLVLLKLIANRPKDLADIADILFVQTTVDEEYLRTWGAKLGVTERLEKAFQDRHDS